MITISFTQLILLLGAGTFFSAAGLIVGVAFMVYLLTADDRHMDYEE